MYLRDLYQQLDTKGREALAARIGIKPGYLWQIATGWQNRKPSLDLLPKIAEAHPRLTVAELVKEFTEEDASKVAPDRPTANGKPQDAGKPSSRKGR